MQAEYSLNIYGENDEIVKTYETNVVRWGIFKKAVELEDSIKGEKNEAAAIEAVSDFMLLVFPGMTSEEIENADAFDIFAVFKQIVKKADNINAGKDHKESKN